jgi:Putative Flp pilus-assembly TadE/G-like
VLVAVSLFALLSMAALAIDVTSLYVASTEAQQAADAAALAGAKAFVTSGYTTYPAGYLSTDTVCNGSNGLADYEAQSALAANTVAGYTPTMTTSCNFTNPHNPTITVRVQRSALPVFFARIWGASGPTVSATATAEAYNPSGSTVPIGTNIKPWLLPNCNPNAPISPGGNTLCPSGGQNYDFFINSADGSVRNPDKVFGQPLTLAIGTGNVAPPNKLQFYALTLPQTPAPLCPSTGSVDCGNTPGPYYDSIACFNNTQLKCGDSVNGPSDPVYVDSRMNTGLGFLKGRTDQGTQCLIRADNNGLSQNQDAFIRQGVGLPVLIEPGANSIAMNPSLAGASYVSRSDSVVTVPVFDGSDLCAGGCSQVNATVVVGFLQLGITDFPSLGSGTVDAVILNASGCNPNPTGNPVAGGNISPIPVRLIQTP